MELGGFEPPTSWVRSGTSGKKCPKSAQGSWNASLFPSKLCLHRRFHPGFAKSRYEALNGRGLGFGFRQSQRAEGLSPSAPNSTECPTRTRAYAALAVSSRSISSR